MLTQLERLKNDLARCEYDAFVRSIASLNSNIAYWTKRLTHEVKAEQKEAQFELNRCNMLLAKVQKDLNKAESKINEV